MRRALVIVPVVLLCLLPAQTASAAKPTREVFEVMDDFKTGVCGFRVLVHAEGTIIVTTHTYKDGSIRQHSAFPGYTYTLTNPGTGESIEVTIAGPGVLEVNPDGSSTFTGTGPWSWFEHPLTGEPGIFVSKGKFVFEFDPEGNLLFSIVGTIVDVCAELA